MKIKTVGRKKTTGFTLIEILVAMLITSIVATIALTALNFSLRAKSIQTRKAERLSDLQLAYVIMQNDIEQALNRPIKDREGNIEPGFWGANPIANTGETQTYLTLTRGGVNNPLWIQPQSALQRVNYVVAGNQLLRLTWQALDRAATSEPSTRILLTGIRNIDFEFIGHGAEVLDSWKTALEPEDFTSSEETRMDRTPHGVRVKFEYDELGVIDWLFALPGGSNEPG